MNKGDGGRQPLLRNGWYKIGNTTFVQEMFYSEVNTATGAVTKIPKGIERILRERNLWPDKGLLLECPKPRCEPCQTLQRCKEVGLLAIFPRSLILINFSDCCARRLLSLQPDFMAQKCEIEERIEAHHRGFSFIQNFTVNLITLNIIGVIARDTLENIVTTLSQAYGRMFQLHYRMSRTVLYWQTIIVA